MVSGDVVVRARAVLVGVTDGPWVSQSDGVLFSLAAQNYLTDLDMAFAAAARSLVPELVEAVERVRALHWPSPTRDPACGCFDGLTECPTMAALGAGQ